ncbi:DUF2798 domain-containing protein [Grimontia sp. NTOU-MAR1]|uniref:DUF2798 domain-containing protein n=1 Tax=Grimontia sp. NTOU-MAR1 TaxID=3111011 RepID=UPI002DBBDB66|nr:DUF2798 domain-containing protein [Grimontia sp. NTOU-MAR1]WRW00348.1 DUF2798 domain-containing protein [Grimontia sp. NTOU-MAR1]
MGRKRFWITTVLSTFVMAVAMSGLISGYKMGFSVDWPQVWVQSFVFAWPCAFLLSVTVLPKVRQFSEWLAEAL